MGFWGQYRGRGHKRRHENINRKKFHYARWLDRFITYGAKTTEAIIWKLVRVGRADAPNESGKKTGID